MTLLFGDNEMRPTIRYRLVRDFRVVLLALGILSLGSSSSQALPSSTTAGVALFCAGETTVETGFGTFTCKDGKSEASGTTGDGVASAFTFVRRSEPSDPAVYLASDASVEYEILLVRNQIPPIAMLDIPLGLDYVLGSFVDGDGTYAGAAIAVGGPFDPGGLFNDTIWAVPGSPGPRPKRETARIRVAGMGPILLVQLFAHADAAIGSGVFEARIARAYADPHVFLDQETFDAEHGEDSFPLEDYYSFEFSPGITNRPVPFADGFESGTTAAWSATVE